MVSISRVEINVCMYVYIYIWCVSIRVYIYIYIRIYIYIHTCIYICICTYIYIHIYMVDKILVDIQLVYGLHMMVYVLRDRTVIQQSTYTMVICPRNRNFPKKINMGIKGECKSTIETPLFRLGTMT